jgi:hypothetical protein
MSKIALSGNASGTGTLTIAAPNTNTNRTLTLPDGAGTIVTDSATQTLTNKSIDGASNTLTSLPAAQLTGDVAADRITSALNATGSAPIYACRAWVNFNGTGTVAIRASGNVSSITDNGPGDYTVNFTTAMPDANYAAMGYAEYNSSPDSGDAAFLGLRLASGSGFSPSSFRTRVQSNSLTILDTPVVCIAIFR